MTNLNTSYEWRLLQSLSSLLGERLSRTPTNQRGEKRRNINVYASSFEWELRSIVHIINTGDLQKVMETKYADFEARSKNLCEMLNSLSSMPSILWVREQQRIPAREEDSIYPRLVRLLMALKDHLEEQITGGQSEFDLTYGPNETLFRIPQEDFVLKEHLKVATAYGKLLNELLYLQPQQSSLQPLPSTRDKPETELWNTAKLRKRATYVLDSIFKRFSCRSHQVLLKLAEESEEDDQITPTLRLSLSTCPTSEIWQEAVCRKTGSSPNTPITDLCSDLQQNINQRMTLELKLEDSKLYGSWTHLRGTGDDSSSKESLHDLISNGAFRLSFNSGGRNKSAVTFSTQEKRALVVKLGYCLMDFFEAGMTSERIFFQDLVRSGSGNAQYIPYLSFGPEPPLPINQNRYGFAAHHTTLPSFAKLLLEVHYGETIDIDINAQNVSESWEKLMERVDDIEKSESGDPYLKAVRNCFQTHQYIAKKLGRRSLDVGKIRKTVHKEVVSKLRLGLAASIPRSGSDRKRQRSESPPRRTDFVHSHTIQVNCDGSMERTRAGREQHANYSTFPAPSAGWDSVKLPTRPDNATLGHKRQRLQVRQQDDLVPRAPPHDREAITHTRNPVYQHQHLAPAQLEGEPPPCNFDERSMYNPAFSIGATDPTPRQGSSASGSRNMGTRSDDLFVKPPLVNEGFLGRPRGPRTDEDVRKIDSRKWKDDFKLLTQRCKPPSTSVKPLKIAILDTGIDYGHSDFAGSNKIKEVRSFVQDDPDGKTDNHGHGTSIAGLVLELTKEIDVDVYVGKVANDKANPDTIAIAEGLKHAADDWKVDMISLSFGFQDPVPAISNKVKICLERDISIFAAASNEAGNGDAMFPANMNRVFCMHAASGAGNKYTHNPHPSRWRDWNFKAVGWDIQCTSRRLDPQAPPSRKPDPRDYVSGTSFAAPVAMCIAAFMVDYIRKTMDCAGFHISPNCPEGVQKLFRLMMSQEPDYLNYISPVAYFQRNRWDKDKSLVRGKISHELST